MNQGCQMKTHPWENIRSQASREASFLVKKCFALFGVITLFVQIQADQRPDLLIITADDMNQDSVGVYGSSIPDATPNIDAMAKAGLYFQHAHAASTACKPSRVAIQTARVGHRSGGEGFHHLRFKNIPTLTKTLKDADYRVGVIGKVRHSTPYEHTPWDLEVEVGRRTDEIISLVDRFITESRAANQPYFLMVNSHDPHQPYYNIRSYKGVQDQNNNPKGSTPSKVYSPDDIIVPEDLPATPEVKHELACYFSSVRRCDDVVGGVMEMMQKVGRPQNTLSAFLSDHGMAKPGAKANVYPQSTLTPFILHMPGLIAPSHNQSDFVSVMDLFPTICELLGIVPPEGLDGESLIPIMIDDYSSERRRLIHTQFYSIIGKKHYQMRCSQNEDFAYIYNAWYNGHPIYRSSSLGGRLFKNMIELGINEPVWDERTNFILRRCPEEFYNLKKDPLCQYNLISMPEVKGQLEKFRQAMIDNMVKTEDYLLPIFQNYLKTRNVEDMQSRFIAILKNEKVIGKAPTKVLKKQDFLDLKKMKRNKHSSSKEP